ncbi:MAG: hypothetical protein PHI59_03810 [Candidatus Omnitrophica bacterium]|nr:hypothetical protein [Candidatus Omnitrophota bacterium]
MKKLIVLGIVVMLAIFAGSVAYADSDSKDVAVTVNVQSVFGFSVWDGELSQEYTIMPGENAIGNLHITASSNHSQLWWINASTDGMVGQYNGKVLPVEISTLSGAGVKVANLVLTSAPQAIYTADATEYPKSGVAIDTLLVVPTTLSTPQDVYKGLIALTMTE